MQATASHNTYEVDDIEELDPYHYQKLSAPDQCIRLLRLQPGRREQAVICELVEHNLSSQTEICYEALSWCWGLGIRNNEITICDGISTFSSEIPRNLLEALVELRLEKSVRTLWVDALCINQADPEEKSVQIPMMSRIYRCADKVCIWLGQDEDTGAGIEFIKSKVLKLDSLDTLTEGVLASEKWGAIFTMLQSDWFLRRWILQEILSARDAVVYYGSASISWQDFSDAVSLFIKVQSSVDGISTIMKKDPRYYHVPGFFEYVSSLGAGILIGTSQSLFRVSSRGVRFPLHSLEYLVHECQMFENSEPRDTIYALLGLANDAAGRHSARQDERHLPNSSSSQLWGAVANPAGLELNEYPVNYTQPYASHCKDFVEFVIRQCYQMDPTRALDVLCRPWAPVPTKQRMDAPYLPSWISTLSDAAFDMHIQPGVQTYVMGRKNADPLIGPPHSNRSKNSVYYTASGNRGVDISTLLFNQQPKYYSLHVSGFIFDYVERAADSAQGGSVPSTWIQTFGLSSEDGDIPIPDGLWRTLVADRGPDGGPPPSYYKRACKEALRRGGLSSGCLNILDLIENERNALITDFCRRVQAVIHNRSLIRTTGGRVGLARKKVKEGDLVCIIYGCSVPVIIREHRKDGCEDGMDRQRGMHNTLGQEETFHELIGECYVDGMMDGEAIEWQEENDVPSVRFELR
jgi:hypothetical protein